MPASIHVDDIAGDVSWACQQKDQGLLDFLCLAPAPERDAFDQIRAYSAI